MHPAPATWAVMPRCYMVKKSKQRHNGPPLYSPTDASTAPPCYNATRRTSTVTSDDQVEPPEPIPYRQFLERTPEDTQAALDLLSFAHGCSYQEPPQPTSPQPQPSPPPALQQFAPAPYALEPIGPEPPIAPEPIDLEAYAPMPFGTENIAPEHEAPQIFIPEHGAPQNCIPEFRAPDNFAPAPFAQDSYIIPEAFVQEAYVPAQPQYIPQPEPYVTQTYVPEQFAPEGTAPEQFVPLMQPDPPVVPVYTYTLQPTNIFIITEEHTEPNYQPAPTVPNPPPFEYMVESPVYVVDQNLMYSPIPADAQVQFVEPIAIPILVETVPVPVPQVVPPPPPPPPQVVMQPSLPPVQPQQLPRLPKLQARPATSTGPKIKSNPAMEPGEVRQPASRDKSIKYDCDECGKQYATSSNLSRHKQTHRSLDSGAAKKCEQCGKAYVSMPALAMHILTHKMGYTCKECGKHFSRPWLLRGHARSHTGERPYDCPMPGCRKAFGDRSNLRAHLQTHSVEKKFGCCRCDKTFALKSYLLKHQESACYQPC
ncbi:extensin-like [Pararge aegeria]|uniref:extensin-like n=1 Tax=Pararge aegeria TaxID=116150 RepID=UPI0019D17C0D|nr:extensin-like [Pararge aegeria]